MREKLRRKGEVTGLDRLIELDVRHREGLREIEGWRAQRNTRSREIAELLRREPDAAEAAKAEVRALGERLREREADLEAWRSEIEDLLLRLPNTPHESVPVGADAASNVVVRTWGDPPRRNFEVRPHWEVGVELGILDFERGAKLAGSGFVVLRGAGARLQRALIAFMLDHHRAAGFEEVSPPFVANRQAMRGSGQIPKMEADMYRVESEDLFLIPTGEVPVTALHADEILDEQRLPLRYVAYTPCFRLEAGAHGRDTRGLIRVHQFDKVEMVAFTRPEDSYAELEWLVSRAESVLQALALPYRVLLLSTGDMGANNAKQYDLEVWAPGVQRWLEVSSVSNFEDYQARRSGIRLRRRSGEATLAHTLNGSGLALPRTLIALLENGLGPDGSVVVPDVLRPYLGGLARIDPPQERT